MKPQVLEKYSNEYLEHIKDGHFNVIDIWRVFGYSYMEFQTKFFWIGYNLHEIPNQILEKHKC